MATKTYEVKIGTTSLSKLVNYEVERNKLWSDADRNMAGDLKATFVGVFPKIKLNFPHMTASEVKTIIALVEPPSLSVSWWDTSIENYRTGSYYASDFTYKLIDDGKGLYEPFSISLIPYKKI